MDRQLLARATENSDAPTPGYMYLDIAKNAAGNPQTCSDIAKYLTGRLASKNNSNIKFKCLKVISKTAVSPYLRGQFKRCLSQDPQAMSAIKDATQFRGPPDPVRGDEPYDKVRKAAKEALDAVYSDTPASDPSVVGGGGSFASSISGSYGNHTGGGYGGVGSAPPGGPRRMEGIGNPMFKDPRFEAEQGMSNMTVNDIVNEAKSTVMGMIKDPLARNASVQISNNQGSMPRPGGSYSGPAGSLSRPPPGRSDLMHQTNGEWTMASNRGPGATEPPLNYANDSAYYKSRDSGGSWSWAQANSGERSNGVGGSWASAATPSTSSPYTHQATPSVTVNSMPSASSVSAGGGKAVADGSYERQLVMELCPPGGMKPEPPPDKLAQFARVVSSLNPDLVCPVLLDCLEEGQPWIIRAKALWVMDTCIQHGKRPGATNNAYADFLHACNAEFAPLANHSRAAIRDPAKRVLNSLGVASPVGEVVTPPLRAATTPAAAPAAPPPEPVVNLLEFDEEVTAAPPLTSAPAPYKTSRPTTPTTKTTSTGGSLFGGLNMASASAAPAAPAADVTTSASSNGDNLLDLMAETSIATSSTSPEINSSFGFINANTTAVAASEIKETSNMLDNLSRKGSNSVWLGEPKTEPAFTVGSNGSAFGFINSVSSTESCKAENKTDAPVSASSTKRDSFDPLKNMTPNSQKQMMQVSPEQMQAMMYQQMMMQQQMQMAKMQMALQHQNRGSSNSQIFMTMPGHVMQNPAASKSTFAFMDQPQKQEDKSFDFVKDAMTTEKKK